MNQVRASVVIVNWNGGHFLGPCLRALAAQTMTDFETIVVDNGSVDGSLKLLQEEFDWVHVLANDRNLGFAAAANQGIEASRAPFVATLNNDTQPDPDWLWSLVEAMQEARDVGACASRMVFADCPEIINSAGIAIDRSGIAWDRHGGRRDDGDAMALEEIFGACAGAALYRKAMLDEIGLFDPDFFAYLEDVDLAWRARAAGWRALYVPAARVTHHHSGTSIEGSAFKSRLLGRNKIWLIAKNYPWPEIAWYAPVIVAYDLGAVLVALLRGNCHALVGRWHGLMGTRKMIAKRAKTNRHVLGQMEPPAPPWTVWQRYKHLGD